MQMRTNSVAHWTPTVSVANLVRATSQPHKRASGTAASSTMRSSAEGTLQRSAVNANPVPAIPSAVHETLRSPGQPLDMATRAFMEPRFGRDFSGVRVHADSQAAESTHAVNAKAYTVGNDIAFGHAQYEPTSSVGRALLAHELTHVAQQEQTGLANYAGANLPIGHPTDAAEQQAERLSGFDNVRNDPNWGKSILWRDSSPVLRRKLMVNPTDSIPLPAGQQGPPQLLTSSVQNLLNESCPSGKFTVDSGTGNVVHKSKFCEWHSPLTAGKTEASTSSTPAGCGCMCGLVDEAQTTTIAFRSGPPSTAPGSVPGAGLGQGGRKTDATFNFDPRVHVQIKIGSSWVDVPLLLIFSHELCGHALPKMRGTHVPRGPQPPGGTPPQEQAAVDAERAVAAEHNPQLPRRSDDYSATRITP